MLLISFNPKTKKVETTFMYEETRIKYTTSIASSSLFGRYVMQTNEKLVGTVHRSASRVTLARRTH